MAGPRLQPRLLARARRSRAHRLHAAQHAEGRRRPHARRAATARSTLYRDVCDDIVRVSHPRGGRADQAAREHLPLGQHRAGQRDGDAHRSHGHRHLGGHRRRRDQALWLHALRARPGHGRPLPARRPVLPLVAGARVRPDHRVHRARRQGQPAACPTTASPRSSASLNHAGKPVKGSRIAVFGVSYKPGVGDVRESPALKIVALLGALGADIVYHDPHVRGAARQRAGEPRLRRGARRRRPRR